MASAIQTTQAFDEPQQQQQQQPDVDASSCGAGSGAAAFKYDRYLLPTEQERLELRKKAVFKNDLSVVLTADIARVENVYLSGKKPNWYLNYHFYDLETEENVVFPFNMNLGHEDFPEEIPEYREAALLESGFPIAHRPGLPIVISDGPTVWEPKQGGAGGGAADRSDGKPKSRTVFLAITSKIERAFLRALVPHIENQILEKNVFEHLGVDAKIMKLASEPMGATQELADQAELSCYKIKDPPTKPVFEKSSSASMRDMMTREYERELATYEKRVSDVKELVGERIVEIYLARKVVSAARAWLHTIPAGKKSPVFRPLVSIREVEETSEEYKAKDGEEPRQKTQIGISINLDEGPMRPTEVYFLQPNTDPVTGEILKDEHGCTERSPLAATCDDLKRLTPVSTTIRTGKMFSASGQHGFTFYGIQFGVFPDLIEARSGSRGGGGGGAGEAVTSHAIVLGKTRIAKPVGRTSEEDLRRIEEIRAAQKKRLEDAATRKDEGERLPADDDFTMATTSGFETVASRKRSTGSDLSSFGKKARN